MPWQIWVVATVLAWGIWGFLNGMALRSHHWQQLIVWGLPMTAAIAVCLFFVFAGRSGFDIRAFGWASLIQLMAIAGVVFFYQALKRQNTAIVVPVSAAYPAVTAILAVLFGKEHLRPVQVLGILLVIGGTAAISLSSGPRPA
jgi:transporter family protein